MTSETKKNTLNPDWNDFFITEAELSGNDKDLNLKFEVFDDDGKAGPDRKDDVIGTCWQSLRQIEAAAMVKAAIPLTRGKGGQATGRLVIRTYREHEDGQGAPSGTPAQGYPSGQVGGAGYPSMPGGPMGSGVMGGPGYPGAGAGYPGGGAGYPGAGASYPGVNAGNPGAGYPGAGASYPGVNTGYPGANPGAGAGYPGSNTGYPGAHTGYPGGGAGGGPGYPGGPAGYPAGGAGDSVLFPPSNLPDGPGGWTKPRQ